jgi:radical SAM superfamily enzyme YgiQ (UPF0313 family)
VKIVLINAPVTRQSPHARLSLPLGLSYIGSALLAAGHEVSAIDFNLGELNYRIVDNIAERERPDLVGISAHTETATNAERIACRIKKKNRDIKIVMGGPHPTILPERTLKIDAVDYVVMGEGEETIAALARFLEEGRGRPSDIEGLAYKDQGININKRRELSTLNESHYPARELFPIDFYREKFNVLTARGGCPYKCPFCSGSSIWNGRRIERDPERVVAEIRMIIERYGADYIFFTDDIFTLNRKWVFRLLGLIADFEYPFEWGCATRVDLVDHEMLNAMARAGCRASQFGVESGSQKILDSVKGIKKEQAAQAVDGAIKAGIDTASSFMIPFPEDTRETIRETKEFIKLLATMGSKILLSFTTPYPGTFFYQHAAALGIRIQAGSWEEFDSKHNIMETKHLSLGEVEDLVEEVAREAGLIRRGY